MQETKLTLVAPTFERPRVFFTYETAIAASSQVPPLGFPAFAAGENDTNVAVKINNKQMIPLFITSVSLKFEVVGTIEPANNNLLLLQCYRR